MGQLVLVVIPKPKGVGNLVVTEDAHKQIFEQTYQHLVVSDLDQAAVPLLIVCEESFSAARLLEG